ncbi:MAG: hypothetical protein JXQ66_04835 [Campylobacterales bacterium]|nr:hypothetical protein [Campylobacterales bacterium]
MRWMLLFLVLFIFSGCDFLDSQDKAKADAVAQKIAFEQKVQESKEIKLKELSAQTQKELAVLESKKELALIEKEKELEKIRMQSELEKQKIIFEQERAKALFEQQMQQNEQANDMELKRYMILLLALLIIVSCFFIYYYFKKRREDKLRAYNDNLQKYFNQKENDARVKIAEKMLDALSSGKLDKEQENQLISAFAGQAKGNYQKQLESKKDEDVIDVDELYISDK